ncbi:MAG: hypothetical protein FJX77_16165 [Armatimonadetes bacterium]|nr:hypothetical protein [Armatimonadota bacterium]
MPAPLLDPPPGVRFSKKAPTLPWGDAIPALEAEVPDGAVALVPADTPYTCSRFAYGYGSGAHATEEAEDAAPSGR